MASLKETKGRITSVKSTQKITSAMRMVASAKFHRTQQLSQNFQIYVDEFKKTVDALGGIQDENTVDISKNGCVLLIPVSSGSGLCGSYNSGILKETIFIADYHTSNGTDVKFMPIGKKVAHDLKNVGKECILDFNLIAEDVGKDGAVNRCGELVESIQKKIKSQEITAVEFIYHHFISMGRQVITREYVDFSEPKIKREKSNEQMFLTEPSPCELIAEVHPKMLNSKVYGILLDSVTSEHASRMLAMQTADDNAKDLLQDLTLLYNKSRQQAITNELIDIMGGKSSES